jgi:hypothetical protein
MGELSVHVIAFLSDGTPNGKLGYVTADGRPLAWTIGPGRSR